MSETSDLVIFWAVVLGRFLIPLLIPRYPLPGVVAALVLDGVDQTIFQQFTNLSLDGYQGYDKALDIYYLTIAYISTLRNWANVFGFKVSRFLFYYRLAGVTMFELSGWRPLLLIFPNTFEYFFIFYETVRLRWDPGKMSKRMIVGAAAAIWIFIKLPQEWWIHIAQMDATDFIKEEILGVSKDAPWSEAIAAAPGVVVAAVVVIAVLVVAIWWVVTRKLPPADRKLAFDVDAHAEDPLALGQRRMAGAARRILDWALAEKIAMVALVAIIFARILPGVQATLLELVVGTAFVITINAFLSEWLSRRGYGWASTLRQFVVMSAVNFGLVFLYSFLLPRFDGSINLTNTLFFALLLTLLVTLYDLYRPIYEQRIIEAELAGDPSPI